MGAGTYPSEKTSGAIVPVRTKLSGRRSSLAWLHEQASLLLLPLTEALAGLPGEGTLFGRHIQLPCLVL